MVLSLLVSQVTIQLTFESMQEFTQFTSTFHNATLSARGMVQ